MHKLAAPCGVMVGVILAGTVLAAGPSPGRADKLAAWSFWTRQEGAGSVAVDTAELRDGGATLRIEHRGQRDWALTSPRRLRVATGDVVELDAQLKLTGPGDAKVAVAACDAAGRVVSWSYGSRVVVAGPWRRVHYRLVVPRGVASVVPRLTGSGPAVVWLGDYTWKKAGNVLAGRRANMPAEIEFADDAIAVTFRTADGAMDVRDLRAGRTWRQQPSRDAVVLACRKVPGGLDATLVNTASAAEMKVSIRLAGGAELTVAVAGSGEMARPVWYPPPFVTKAGTYLVVPMNEGISYPVDDETIHPRRLIAYGGHGICMAFWGVTDGSAGQMAIIETPDDAVIDIGRADGLLRISPVWQAQKGRFGYERRLRYVFFDRGGYVAMCKRYRRYVRQAGRLRTLAEKRKAVPAVDLLVGAVNVWCWDREPLSIVRDMQAAGIKRILWSHRGSGETIRAMNRIPGVLTSRYDIYQDVMDPANFKFLRGIHPDWSTAAWPKDVMRDARGQWRRGWRVRGKDGKWYSCGVLCDSRALDYARRRVPADLKDHPYRCRFIDTTTASPWRECYDPNHPMTRSDSRHWKMQLLRFMSETCGLVTGSETGHDAAVPFVHYFEGMMSLGPYRVPDAGRNVTRIWNEVPPRVAKFQLGHRYRLPLWELVYHDCVVAYWYWGDYNNKLPSLWDKRDLFNALYGTPPMFMFDRRRWRENRDRFARSYRATCPIARATGYSEMLDHRFLTPDRDVQQTRFADGTVVTVNFGEKPYHAGPVTLAPMSCRVQHAP
ncbi:MAG: hypothetical protein J7M21_01525 [Planctomycetes bacterium]|nr:hypothetical protein [Planctomycetota bacterium]